jgi:hypothetical protein
LLLWHFVEEVEYRSSALVIHHAAVGDGWYRIGALSRVARHLMRVSKIIADGVHEHVPEHDRKVDARTLLPTFWVRQTLRHPLTFASRSVAPSAFSTVPGGQSLFTGVRILLSQTPFHDPAHEPLPEFAGRWFDRWNSGGDVTRWYTP